MSTKATETAATLPSRITLDAAAMAAVLLATSLALLMLNVAPAVEAQLRQASLFSTGQIGAAFGFELGAMGLASLPAYRWFGQMAAPRVARWGCAAFIAGSLLSAQATMSFALYAAARIVTGLGAGTLMVLGMGLAARTRHPDRLYALITFTQLASGALVLAWLAGAPGGLRSLFQAAALIAAFGFVAAGAFARVDRPAPLDASAAPRAAPDAMRHALALALVFNVAVGGLWSFAGEYAAVGSTPDEVSRVLAWATAAGLAGAAAALLLGDRWPRRHLLWTGCAGLLLGAALLHARGGAAGFAAGCCMMSLAWNFSVPYVFAAVAAQDPSGRSMSGANMAFAFGLALGPLLAGELIEALGLDALFPAAAMLLAMTALLTPRRERPA